MTSRVFPFAASHACQFYTYSNIWFYFKSFGYGGDQLELIELFNDKKDAFPHFLCQKSKLNIIFILVTVANYKRLGVSVNRQNRMQFRFRTCLKPDVEFFAMADNFFNNRSHLVHLDRVNNKILSSVVILL